VLILWSSLEEDDIERLRKSWNDLDFLYEFQNVDSVTAPIAEQSNFGFWSYFWLDRFLPNEVERVLYLDCDIVCSRDISELWDVDLGDCVAGAVPDPLSLMEPMAEGLGHHGARLVGLEFKKTDTYFNSGAVLIDLPKWRKEDLASKVADRFRGGFGDLPLHDQDSLNLLLRNRILELPPCWNLIEYARLYGEWPFEIYTGEPMDYFENKIRHFSGERKPDRPWVRLSDKKEFYGWLDQTDWRGWRSDWDRSLASLVFSRLLEKHYLVCRGLNQKTIREPKRRLLMLLLDAPYLLPIYALLPLYRLSLRFWAYFNRYHGK
jgi:lipopolysaccharide biosynthesis glycosyltransferase